MKCLAGFCHCDDGGGPWPLPAGRQNMAVHYNQGDREILTSIAEYRVLCVRHLSLLHARNVRALRRRLCRLEDDGLLQMGPRGFGRSRGRPEQVLSLTEAGVEKLKADGVVPKDIRWEQIGAENLRCVEHQLLLNELRLQLSQVARIAPSLKARFLYPASGPFGVFAGGIRLGPEGGHGAGAPKGPGVALTPDGVFAIADTVANRTVLFFVEVDMGTESLASPLRTGKDVRQKILTYQAFFRARGYESYEQACGAALRGFRLLFLSNSVSRMMGLCLLVRQTPPSQFIWLTNRESMLSKGACAPVWIRGGRYDTPPESILGSRCPNPRPADLR